MFSRRFHAWSLLLGSRPCALYLAGVAHSCLPHGVFSTGVGHGPYHGNSRACWNPAPKACREASVVLGLRLVVPTAKSPLGLYPRPCASRGRPGRPVGADAAPSLTRSPHGQAWSAELKILEGLSGSWRLLLCAAFSSLGLRSAY